MEAINIGELIPELLSGGLIGVNIESGTNTINAAVDLLDGATLENQGALAIAPGGSIGSDGDTGDTIKNDSGATLVIDTGATVSAAIFDNSGGLIASPGTNNTATVGGVLSYVNNSLTFTGFFNNTGTIQVQSGTLDLYEGGLSNASAFSVASSATLLFTGPLDQPFTISGGTYNVAGTTEVGDASYAGKLVFDAGTTVYVGSAWVIDDIVDMSAATLIGSFTELNLKGDLYLGANNITISNLTMAEGSLLDTGIITLSGTSNATGNLVGAGTVRNVGTLTVAGQVGLFYGMDLVNDSILTVSGGSIASGNGNSNIQNDSGATFNLTGYTEVLGSVIINAGLLYIASGSGGSARLYCDLDNTGTIQILSGTTTLGDGGSSNADAILVAQGAELNIGGAYTFTGGSYDVAGTTIIGGTLDCSTSTEFASSIENLGVLEIESGTLILDESATGSGTVILDVGTTLVLGLPSNFSNSISGFVAGSTIDLLNTPATSALINASNQIVVSNGATVVATLSLSGKLPNPGAKIGVRSDGAAGVDLFAATTQFDLFGSGTADVIWRNATTGVNELWEMSGKNIISDVGLGVVPGTWSVGGVGDFNGDGKADMLWRNSSTGAVEMWLMNGGTVTSDLSLGTIGTAWSVAGIGDLNGDGKSDIIWRNGTTGATELWLMNGATVTSDLSLGTVSTAWHIAGTGDFNGDGKTDIVWRNNTTGANELWLMNGSSISSDVALGAVGTAWTLAGIGDFNGDGKSDLLWRNASTGAVEMWQMNGATVTSDTGLSAVGSAWSVAEVGDFNGDGKADILWRNGTTGALEMWTMNGSTISSDVGLSAVPAAWSIQSTLAIGG